ncbi:NUDIX hydrolase [Nocardiopsis sp. TSRI0078]|uniref:NUDIX domain-containing protein n=1 Tax=unclassified Nocardiopsis TaxID=2649073 RepID=UPI00093F1AC5|nr:NUDIX hydrolase [Nocardiopsis sp. TSRI0078]OKI18975.1 NUDIX hydrolase [Nocardiopsis sp. TSRI0078]
MASDPTESFSRPRVAAGALFFNHLGQVMMVVPSYKDYLDIPGGYIEHGETPTQAVVREVKEELGIAPPIGRLLVVDWAPNPSEGDKQLFVFDGGVLDQGWLNQITLDPAELTGYEFHDVATIESVTIPRLARRVAHGARARQEGTTVYLENGETIS